SNDGTNEIQYGKSNYYSFQHPAVQRICNTDYSALFSPAAR
ncbi:hypothetical protein ACUOCP_50325, partial [Escherichia sp. R-CC3]